MNTATLHETTAIAAAVAAVTALQELLLIPLSRLRPSSHNVRKSGGTSIPELAASIARVGLLQNLNVVLAADGEHYEVVAGRRRLAALKLLVKRRKLAKDFEVAVAEQIIRLVAAHEHRRSPRPMAKRYLKPSSIDQTKRVPAVKIEWAKRKALSLPLLQESDTEEKRNLALKEFKAKTLGKPGPTADQVAAFKATLQRQFGPSWRLQRRFVGIHRLPWQPAAMLPETIDVDQARLWRAALNSGYGIFRQSHEAVAVDERASWQADGFAEAWKRRATDLVGYVTFADGTPCAFWKRLEKSDKAVPSFALGSAFCRLAAQAWLKADGRKIREYWHYAIYGPALLHPSRDWFKGQGPSLPLGSAPDYLVIDDVGELHLFESKAGSIADAWKRLEKGLHQLEAIKKVKLMTVSAAKPPKSAVAVYTCIEAGKKITMKAYDPPVEAAKKEPQSEPPPDLWVHDDVAYCMAAADAADLFDALDELPTTGLFDSALNLRPDAPPVEGIRWKRTAAGLLGLMRDPSDLKTLWSRLGVYLTVRAMLPVGPSPMRGRGRDRWKAGLVASTSPSAALGDAYGYFNKALELASAPNELLVALAEVLGFGRYRSSQSEAMWTIRAALSAGERRFDVEESGLVFVAPLEPDEPSA
ncbi:MAG: hypothetical protein EOO27_10340 [Comamonadaceae bacterium]|nr:MAG: hypothetical protein EOO27_10340 [Comamonadaceae bacterium]